MLPLVLLCLSAIFGSWIPMTSATITQCTFNSKICGCDTDQGPISLKGATSSRFSVAGQTAGTTFYWKPCGDFSFGGKTASAIQEQKGNPGTQPLYYDVGSYSTTQGKVLNGNAYFVMLAADRVRTSKFLCQCQKDQNSLQFSGENPPTIYNFVFNSKYCCPGASGGSSGSGGLSFGSVLLIILLVVVIVYLIFGIAFTVGYKKAEGRERIPNVNFWVAIPGLVKDGVMFTVRCGKGNSTYNEV